MYDRICIKSFAGIACNAILIAVSLSALFGSAGMATGNDQHCLMNLRTLEGAAEMYDMDAEVGAGLKDLEPGLYPIPEELVKKKYVKSMRVCHSGGQYKIQIPKTKDPSEAPYKVICSVHGDIKELELQKNRMGRRSRRGVSLPIPSTRVLILILAVAGLVVLLYYVRRKR